MIETAYTLLYPAHLMIGGWRMFFAAVLLAVYGVCYGLWWVFDSIYHFGVMRTVADAYHNTAALVSEFPFIAAIVVLIVVVPVFLLLLPIFRWFTELLIAIWLSLFNPFVRAPRLGLITAAEILTRGYDPDDFDFEGNRWRDLRQEKGRVRNTRFDAASAEIGESHHVET